MVPSLILVIALAIFGQESWRESYERGDYRTAASGLHSEWMAAMRGPWPAPELAVLETLGRLYESGLGVPQDPVLACSIFEFGALEARRPWPPHPLAATLATSRDRVCTTLQPRFRKEASELIGCPRFGLEAKAYSIAPDRVVRIDRSGLHLDHRGHEHEGPLPLSCGGRLALTRHTRVDGNASANHLRRDFLEVFVWRPAKGPGRRTLQWQLHELTGDSFEVRGVAEIGEEDGEPWAAANVRPEWTEVAFRRMPDGDLQWTFNYVQLSETVPALDVEIAPEAGPDLPKLSTNGNNILEVIVVDGFGSPLHNAEVKLNGVVERTVRTDERGSAAFDRLPNARFDVTARRNGSTALRPAVVDLPRSEPVVLTLKPIGHAAGSIACGLNVGRTIESLAASAQVVLHVQVEDQRVSQADANATSERERLSLITSSHVRVLNTFKTTASSVGRITWIQQAGGLIDRGDAIDLHQANGLPPLNVGDEYVVFLGKRQNGELWLDFPEAGVFLIRNGRVLPHGSSRVAEAWRNRSADRFLEALRARVR